MDRNKRKTIQAEVKLRQAEVTVELSPAAPRVRIIIKTPEVEVWGDLTFRNARALAHRLLEQAAELEANNADLDPNFYK